MAELYLWPWPARVLMPLLIGLCVLSQSLAMVLSFYGRRRLKALPELGLLALILLGSSLYGQLIYSYDLGLLVPVGWGPLRFAVKGHTAAWVFLAALLILLGRGVVLSLRRAGEIKTGISALSVKNAIDSLHTGVLFGEPDGFILLSNAKMQWLMTRLTGRVQRNGQDFYCLLASGTLMTGCVKTEFEGQIVCLLEDGRAWMFTRTPLRIGKKSYTQLTAVDITERWELTARLRQQNEQLKRLGEGLKEAIARLHILSRERETQRAKMRAHDILGQRLTLLLRTVQGGQAGQALDYDLLRSLARGLMDELKAVRLPSPQDTLDSLRQAFASIGVEILLEGTLPEDAAVAQLFTEIIREGATNAVRHGYATQVRVEMGPSRLRLTNNGPPPPVNFRQGGGLSGMQKKLDACGAALQVTTSPQFVLTIELPGGDKNA